MYHQKSTFSKQRGFTLVELLLVIVTVSIAVATINLSTGANEQFKLTSTAQEIERYLIYLQDKSDRELLFFRVSFSNSEKNSRLNTEKYDYESNSWEPSKNSLRTHDNNEIYIKLSQDINFQTFIRSFENNKPNSLVLFPSLENNHFLVEFITNERTVYSIESIVDSNQIVAKAHAK